MAVPILLVIITGILLLKKEFAWIQPPTQRGTASEPSLPFDRILKIAGLFRSSALILLGLWVTGLRLFVLRYRTRRQGRGIRTAASV